MTKVGPLWLIWLRCRCYCFFFSCFYEFFRSYCCCFAAHKYVHHEYCHFMFLYFSFHLFFSEKAKKIRTSTSKNSKSTKSKRIKTVLVVVCLIWMIFFSAKNRRDMGDSAKPEANIPNGFNRFSINRV